MGIVYTLFSPGLITQGRLICIEFTVSCMFKLIPIRSGAFAFAKVLQRSTGLASHRLSLPHISRATSITNHLTYRPFHHTAKTQVEEIKIGRPEQTFTIHPDQQVKTRVHGSLIFSRKLDPKYRLGNQHMYILPDGQTFALAKRATLIFGIVGLIFADGLAKTGFVLPEFSTLITLGSLIPYPVTQFLSRPVVTRIWRLYDMTKVQNLENLVEDETLIFERIDWRGGNAFNELIKVNTLRLPTPRERRLGWVNLVSEDPNLKTIKYFYVKDNMGGMNMDRIWSIAEKNSGVDNGRHFFKY